MDIQAIIEKYGPALTRQLTSKSGFTPTEAQGFVPALIEKVVGVVKGGGVDLKSLFGGNVSSLIAKLDLASLAKTAGVDRAKAEAGAREVVPSLVAQLQSDPGGLEGLLGKAGMAGGAQDLMKKAGKLFGSS